MTIQDWGAIGEIVGALAVVASLIYLAMQVRHNTRQMALNYESDKLSAFERNVESGNRARNILLSDPSLAELFLKGLSDFKSLSSVDKFRCDMLFRNLFSSIHGGYIRHVAFDATEQDLSGPVAVLDSLVRNPGVRQWLTVAEPDWRPEFAELVKERSAHYESDSSQPAPATDESND